MSQIVRGISCVEQRRPPEVDEPSLIGGGGKDVWMMHGVTYRDAKIAEGRPPIEDIIDHCLAILRQKLLQELSKYDFEHRHTSGHSFLSDDNASIPSIQHAGSFMGNSSVHSMTISLDDGLAVSKSSHTRIADTEQVASLDNQGILIPSVKSRNSAKKKVSMSTSKILDTKSFYSDPISPIKGELPSSLDSMDVEGELLPVWRNKENHPSYRVSRMQVTVMRSNRYSGDDLKTGDAVRSKGCCQKFVTKPGSPSRIVWDVLSIFFLSYDLVLIPMVLVFDMPEDVFLDVMSTGLACFWTFDMIFTFLLGFHSAGIIEMRPYPIAVRYIKTWFFLDFVAVVSDWITFSEIASADTLGFVRIFKSFRIARVFRVLRLLRIWKLFHLFSRFGDYVNSANTMQLFGIGKFMLVILLLNHYIACTWYALARYHPNGIEQTWIGEFETAYSQANLLYTYSTALHWSFTQFTPASMEVYPRNTSERFFAVIVLLSGLVIFSSFVSGITSAMTKVRENNKERGRQEDSMRRYITENRISLELGRRIHSFLKSRGYSNKTRVLEDEIAAFKVLPPQIMMDLHVEVFFPIITRHPLFHEFSVSDELGLMEICHRAMNELAAVKGQEIFSLDQSASRMCFVLEGSLLYFYAEDPRPMQVDTTDFISEAALWLHWSHRGRLQALSTSVLVELRALDLHATISRTQSYTSCSGYAREFAKHLVACNGTTSCESRDFANVSIPVQDTKILTDIWRDMDHAREMAQRAFEDQQLLEADSRNRFGNQHSFGRPIKTMMKFLRHKAKTQESSICTSMNSGV